MYVVTPEARIGKLSLWANLPHCCFLLNLQVKNVFYIFTWLKIIKRRVIFCDTWKLYKIQISRSIIEMLLKYAVSFAYCLRLLLCSSSRIDSGGEAAVRIVWLTEMSALASWSQCPSKRKSLQGDIHSYTNFWVCAYFWFFFSFLKKIYSSFELICDYRVIKTKLKLRAVSSQL